MVESLISSEGAQAFKGVKRKATIGIVHASKRARGGLTSTQNRKTPAQSISLPVRSTPTIAEESDSSTTSDNSSYDSFSDHDTIPSRTPTPLTPVSSKPSPRYSSTLKLYHCSYDDCSKTFNRPARLAEHLRSHTNERPYACPYTPCTKDFRRETHLKHHVKSAHTNVRDYVCDLEGCGKSFLTGTRLKRHIAAHEGREKHKCGVAGCGQTFRKHGTLQKHISIEHEGKMPFVCENIENGIKCDAGFDTLGKLKKHEERAHESVRYWCTICDADDGRVAENGQTPQGTAFSTYSAFQSHNRDFHPPTCAECGLKCGSSKELTRHFEIKHGAQSLAERQTHTCTEQECGRSFTSKANLNTHIRTRHKGERRFVCGEFDLGISKRVIGWNGKDACGKSYTTKANLEEHVRTAHMGLDYTRKVREKKTQEEVDSRGRSGSTKKKSSAISRLVGSAYDEDPTRNIPCLQAGCDLRFTRDYDLEIHLQSVHKLAYFEVEHLRAEQEGRGPSTYGYELVVEHNSADG